MDKRERMAREKRARAKAGRVERVKRRRADLDRARALDAAAKEMKKTLLSGRLPDDLDTDVVLAAAGEKPLAEDDAQVTAQGEAAGA